MKDGDILPVAIAALFYGELGKRRLAFSRKQRRARVGVGQPSGISLAFCRGGGSNGRLGTLSVVWRNHRVTANDVAERDLISFLRDATPRRLLQQKTIRALT